jgi:hypothetical protein
MSSEQVSHHNEFTNPEEDPRCIEEGKPFVPHMEDTGQHRGDPGKRAAQPGEEDGPVSVPFEEGFPFQVVLSGKKPPQEEASAEMSKKRLTIAPPQNITGRIPQDAAGIEQNRYDPDVESPHACQDRPCQKENLSVDKQRKWKNGLDIGSSQKDQVGHMLVLFEKEEKMVHTLYLTTSYLLPFFTEIGCKA